MRNLIFLFSVNLLYFCCIVLSSDEHSFGGKYYLTNENYNISALANNVTKLLKKVNDQENRPQLEFIRSHSVTYQLTVGIKYQILAEMKVNGSHANCTIGLHEQPFDYIKFDVDCGNEGQKYQWYSDAVKLEQRAIDSDKSNVTDELTDIPCSELGRLTFLWEKTFFILRTQRTDHPFRMHRITNAKCQYTLGVLVRYNLTVAFTKNNDEKEVCSVIMLEKLLENILDVNIGCANATYHVAIQITV